MIQLLAFKNVDLEAGCLWDYILFYLIFTLNQLLLDNTDYMQKNKVLVLYIQIMLKKCHKQK